MRCAQLGLGLVLTLGLATAVPRAQQTRQIWARVADLSGEAITGLSADTFTIVEDGVKCRTLKAEPIQWPTRVTVLVDNGGKSGDYLLNLRNGLRGFMKEVPGDVEMSLLTLAPQPRWVVRPTTDPQELAKGVGLVTPNASSGKFFDGLLEAADRAAKDKGNFFPVFVVVASSLGTSDPPLENQYKRLQRELVDRGASVHFVLLSVSSQSVGEVTGVFQSNMGNQLTAMTGGRFEEINAATRLDTLLPEIGKRIAQSVAKQKYEYRLTFEAPKGALASAAPTIGVEVAIKGATIDLSADGHLP